MIENNHFEDEQMILITGKKVSEILNNCDLKELLHLSALLTLINSV